MQGHLSGVESGDTRGVIAWLYDKSATAELAPVELA